jgi:hypothetical protein
LALVNGHVQHVAGEGAGGLRAALGVEVPALDLGDQRVIEGGEPVAERFRVTP